MRYVFLLASDPGEWERADEATRQGYFEAHTAFERFCLEHTDVVDGAALADADTATTVRHVDGRPVVSDGPFVELVEQLGGYYDVDLPSLDVAVEAAKLLPAAYTVEIRPRVVIEGYEGA